MTHDIGIPVLDNHMHCDPRNGQGIDAVKKFARSGGTHLCMVNKPSWHLGVEPTQGDDYRSVFEETLGVAENARRVVDGDVFPVLGVHPAVISRLEEEHGLKRTEEIMKHGLEVASEYVEEGKAVALKSGRPHYDVSEEMWDASNRVMQHAFKLGAEIGCAVQLHTERASDLTDIADLAKSVGMPPDKVIKHYAPPDLKGPVPSVMSNEDEIRKVIEDDRDFLMETDYIDDNDRPGAVLGVRTVPRRVRKLIDEHGEAMYRAHVEVPERIYDVNMEVSSK